MDHSIGAKICPKWNILLIDTWSLYLIHVFVLLVNMVIKMVVQDNRIRFGVVEILFKVVARSMVFLPYSLLVGKRTPKGHIVGKLEIDPFTLEVKHA